ncbi:histidine phosphotransferase family protein [uncultured Litoreibacter sp.]|uniref:histidine phosphotransferase family protein n=1 Tax=uncultured Litoreibacter sp. TaxID=1392394 RepID=UPI0026036E9A|nr:histidine phosphotransferase family protein [uncultured Litoreibacter sp.]
MSIDLKDSAALLGSRICHDLISPLGAISNGVELLAMSGVANTPEMKLIEEAVDSANARVKFFRVALGAATGSQMMSRANVLKLLDGCYGGGRISVRWSPPSDPTRTEAKIAFLALMCVETTLPQGGEIVVNADRGNWQLQAFGPVVRFDADVWSSLNRQPSEPLSSNQVQFQLLKDAFEVTGQSASVGHSDSAVSVRY